jgi:integrase
MATVSYHLRNAKAAEPTPIFMLLYADGKQTKVKTGLRIHPNQWDTQGQKAKTRGKGMASTNGQTNDDLASMGKRAIEFYGQKRLIGRLPTGVEIWEAIKPTVGGTVVAESPPRPLPDFDKYIEGARKRLSAATINSKRTTLGHLAAFSELLPKPLEYTDFTREFKDEFTAYLSGQKGMADSSVNRQLMVVKSFLAYAADHGRTPRIDVSGWNWKYKEPEIIALTAEELVAIQELSDLSPSLENARDLFLLMCLTGLRYSDAMRLKPEHDRGELLHLAAKKTGNVLQVYIRKALRPILNRYWAGKLRLIDGQGLRNHIRELGRRAGIDTPTETISYYAQTSQPVRETHPKYKLLGTHSGRRTFVTLSIDRGAPVDVVMQATGHKNYKTLQRYNQTTAKRQVEVSRRMWGEEDNAS